MNPWKKFSLSFLYLSEMSQSQKVRKEFGVVDIKDSLVISAANTVHVGTLGDGFDLSFDGTNTLNIDPVNANDVLRVGETNQADVQFDGATDLLWDASVGSLTNGGFFVPCIPNAVTDAIAAGNPGAISVANYGTQVSVDAGGDAFTLADGTKVGQLKEVTLYATAGGTAVITPATFADGTTITLTAAGDKVVLMWVGASGWRAISGVNATIA